MVALCSTELMEFQIHMPLLTLPERLSDAKGGWRRPSQEIYRLFAKMHRGDAEKSFAPARLVKAIVFLPIVFLRPWVPILYRILHVH